MMHPFPSIKTCVVFALLLSLLACKKTTKKDCPYADQVCDSSQFILINRTQDTVFYGIGSNMWEDTLLPTQQKQYAYGRVNITYDDNCEEKKESWATHQLYSNFGSWAFNIDHCLKKSAFEYDKNKTVVLYDVSDE